MIFYDCVFLNIEATILAGVGNSLIWNIVGYHMTACAEEYAKVESVDAFTMVALFFGINGTLVMFGKKRN